MADLHVEHTLRGVKLGPKIGPLPAAVWVVIILAGLYVAHRRSAANNANGAASTDTTASTDTSTSSDTSTSTDTTSSDVPYGVSSSTPTQYDGAAGTGTAGTSAAVSVTDNVSWQQAAINALVKDGFTATLATSAIDKYLAGQALTQAEAHAVNVAVATVGAPPEGAPPVHVKPPATPTPNAPRPSKAPVPPAPRTSHPTPKASNTAPRPTRGNPPRGGKATGHYTVQAGDTLTAIAARHHVGEPALYQRNAGVIEAAAKRHGRSSSDGGHWIFPGTVLVIPS